MKILISGSSFGKIDKKPFEILKNSGLDIVMNPFGRDFEIAEFSKFIEDAVGLIAGTEKISREVLEKATSLKVISRFGTGTDNIDVETAAKRGIVIRRTPDILTESVAELTLALVLNLCRRLCEVDRRLRNGEWMPLYGSNLYGKTLGIVGLGRIGKAFVKLVEPFRLKLFANEPNPDYEFVGKHNVELVSISRLLEESDVVSLHCSASKDNTGMIGERELAMMKPGTILINTARGSLVDEKALISALKEGVIGGAAIDTFADEPYSGELTKLPNVVLTPHIGSFAKETRVKMEIEAVENLLESLKELEAGSSH